MIVQFGLYLIFKYSNAITSSLTLVAATRATDAKWDKANNCAKSPEDEPMSQLVTITDGMDWLTNPP